MSPSKNVPFYNGVSEVLDDLRFDNLFKEESGVSGSFRARNRKEINKHLIENDKECMDSDYEMFWSSLIDHQYISSRKQGNVKRKRYFSSDSEVDESFKEFLASHDKYGENPEFILETSDRSMHRNDDERPIENIDSDSEVGERLEFLASLSKCGESPEFILETSDRIMHRNDDERPIENIDSNSEVGERLEFLASLSKCGESPEVILETSDRNMHQKDDDESSSDLKIFSLDDINEGDYTSFVPSTLFPSSSRSQFREKLMALVRTPYDQNEYVDLWRKITERKSGQGDRRHECRKLRKLYSTKRKEKSRLDWHPKLRMKIDEFRSDPCKVLYLLRGFFFWLENTVHEDAFVPWLDSLYLKALGRDSGDLRC